MLYKPPLPTLDDGESSTTHDVVALNEYALPIGVRLPQKHEGLQMFFSGPPHTGCSRPSLLFVAAPLLGRADRTCAELIREAVDSLLEAAAGRPAAGVRRVGDVEALGFEGLGVGHKCRALGRAASGGGAFPLDQGAQPVADVVSAKQRSRRTEFVKAGRCLKRRTCGSSLLPRRFQKSGQLRGGPELRNEFELLECRRNPKVNLATPTREKYRTRLDRTRASESSARRRSSTGSSTNARRGT